MFKSIVYYIKSLFFMVVTYSFSTFYFLIGMPVLLSERITYAYVKIWTKIVIFLLQLFGVRTQIYKDKNIPDQAAIFCSNHQSYYEIVLLLSQLPRPVFIMKSSIMRVPLYNLYCKRMGMIPVDRSRRNIHWMTLAIKELNKGKQVVIFPEGTRNLNKNIPYKLGAFKLAKEMNMQITPVRTNSGEIWEGPGFLKQTGTAYIKFFKPINPEPDLLRETITENDKPS
ncbi:MAG: 1-acyl-sn-glycerol-3-phosphate acyltransferase [Alphaproteobacteria bacterium]|nr:MAG: 1-acyl-sn-glycerol-3-phosphate acyltransferase [Alphaproteobacteria bacterium]